MLQSRHKRDGLLTYIPYSLMLNLVYLSGVCARA